MHTHVVGNFENNFFAGRTFTDWDDLNEQALRWCDEKNRSFKRHLKPNRSSSSPWRKPI